MFQTPVTISPSAFHISYESSIMTFGSCFAENIGKKMKQAYFETEINPFGVLYNPISIKNSIEFLLENKEFTQNDLFENRGLWQSFSYSSLFSDISPQECLSRMNTSRANASEFLQKTDVLLITFGTAWIFEERKSGRVVSNCHKLPASHFYRRRLFVEEIIVDYTGLIERLTNLYPALQVVFSVSPIRHWKDGPHENNLSKSSLLLAVEGLQLKFRNVHYFPAYEIQLDELRDYRFYASDMFHPSDVAVDYIWQKFSTTYFEDKTMALKKEFEQLATDLLHRPMFPDSPDYKTFQRNLEKRKAAILSDYPELKSRIQ